MLLATCFLSKELCTRRAVRRALQILVSWSGTARGTLSSCDYHQRGAMEVSQPEEDKQDSQCGVAAWAGLAICGAILICAEPSWTVIRIVVAMSIEQFERDLSGAFGARVQDLHIKAERDARNPGRKSEIGRERAWRSCMHAPPRGVNHHAGEDVLSACSVVRWMMGTQRCQTR
jgi:hypothetical protein